MIESFERSAQRARQFRPTFSADRIGQEPVGATTLMSDVLSGMLDHVDYPMFLIALDMQLLHANKAGWRSLDELHAFRSEDGELHLACKADFTRLRHAIETACSVRRLRSFVRLERSWGGRDTVSVLPQQDGQNALALVMLGKVGLCEALSLDAFARNNGLTASEARVLDGLCAGQSSRDIAKSHGVALSTIRTQLGNLRAKTGSRGISHLLRQVASLPPLVSALASGSERLI